MAERRMLSKKITEHDNFTSLPATAQALYVHLVLNADDDGLCDKINIALNNSHAKKKDLDALVKLHYIIKFDSGVLAIKHWGMQNSIRKDRYTPTEYQEELATLTLKPNGAYSMPARQPNDNQTTTTGCQNGNQMATNGCQDGNQTTTKCQPLVANPLPQDRLGKDRLGKDRVITGDYTHTRAREGEAPEKDPDGFEAFWATYPRKSGDIKEAYMTYLDALADGANPGTLITAAQELAERNTAPEDFRHIPSAEKWLRNTAWLEKPPEQKAKISKTEAFVSAGREHKYTQDEMNALIDGLEKI